MATQKTMPRTILSLARQGRGKKKSDLVANTIFQSLLKKKISTADKRTEHSGRAILGKTAVSSLNAPQLTL